MVDMPGMHKSAIKIRRGRRTDFPALQKLFSSGMPALADKAQVRHWRRLASDPGLDFYVAEQDGAILGALLVCYVRVLREPGWQAILDMASLMPSVCSLGPLLVNFAKARARKRGCRQLLAWRTGAAGDDHFNVLMQGGFRPFGEVLSCDL
jgi:hypothetical protein